MALKMPELGKAQEPATHDPHWQPGLAQVGQDDRAGPAPLPLIGKLRVAQQLQLLLALFAALAGIAAFVVFNDYRVATYGTTYVSIAGDLRTLTQRIARSVQSAASGNAQAFGQLQEARERFGKSLVLLAQGGEIGGIALPPTSDAVMPSLEALMRAWDKSERLLALVLAQQKSSGSFGVASLLARDANTMRELRQALAKGGETLKLAPPRAAELLEQLGVLDRTFQEIQQFLTAGVENPQALATAMNAARHATEDTDALLRATDKLLDGYRIEIAGRAGNFWVLTVLMVLGALVIVLMVKVYTGEQQRRAAEAERQRGEQERQNRSTQEATLRLMDELRNIANGDLTVKATVAEDVVGAIADSVNSTIEELRNLVGRINSAATQVSAATEGAQATSMQLLAAADQQSGEIQRASVSVLEMAKAMKNMSAGTAESASVARQSLGAAKKGEKAVQESISGMNEIRGQIQDTSKRMKRLGESSQEIGEIVELISDITEQTNVLALNAAIQAASAGEAGRGFAVVAEEVQRLAERSAEATKRIGALVKAIQADTQDAAAAMEKSTQGVVEGAKLSDAAGQALIEIDQVSMRLAQLIESTSGAAQKQAQAAMSVAGNMQAILRVTQQTTAGIERTAASVGQLAQLARELKGSVSRFKTG